MSPPVMDSLLPVLGWVLLYFVWQGLLIARRRQRLWLLRDAARGWR